MSVPDFTGIPNGGITPQGYFKVGYDKNQAVPEKGQARATLFYPLADGIYSFLQGSFPGVTIPGIPIQLLITVVGIPTDSSGNPQFGAYWTSTSGGSFNIFLTPSDDMNNLQYLLVEEFSEIFMLQQKKGWFGGTAGTEGENGEALSIFLGREWALANSYSAGSVGNTWMTSSRPNTLGDVDPRPDYGVKVAGNVLFLTYLKYQLNFATKDIIAAGDSSSKLSAVYKNLTTDTNDPYYLFKSLLDSKYPGAIPSGVDPDSPWPIGILGMTFIKNSYGKDDVGNQLLTGGLFPDEFSVDIEGFNLRTLKNLAASTTNTNISLTLEPFPDIGGFPADASKIDYLVANNDIPQKVSYWYNVQFNSVADFPSPGSTIIKKLEADFTLLQKPFGTTSYSTDPAFANLDFFSGADPRFQNVTTISVSPTADNQYYLSNDLRIFTFTPGITPTLGGLTFSDPYQYLKDFLTVMNNQYNDPFGTDPFTGSLAAFPQPTDALTDASSVAPYTYRNNQQYNNYNFAIARVRLDGSSGDTATGVKVFFRLWTANTPDAWFDTTNIYTTTTVGTLDYPIPAPNDYTFPVFGTLNPVVTNAGNSEFGTNGATPPVATGLNIRDLTVPPKGRLWAYYGCFLDLYSNPSPYPTQLLGGTHHCMVAQIDYPPSPIVNANGQWATPRVNDKLAQRNLSYYPAGNPVEQTQIIPHSFDTTPTTPVPSTSPPIVQRPDDLLISWATVPTGSTATVYWPGVNASDVITLANTWYSYHSLTALDTNTLSIPITSTKLTYIPVPTSTGEKFAGLITINLPGTIHKGMEFTIVVQRITTVSFTPPDIPRIKLTQEREKASSVNEPTLVATDTSTFYWRQILGSFSLRIPVIPAGNLLPQEYDTLAILRWRLTQMPSTNRWFPVLQRLVTVVEGRIQGAGGDPTLIPPGGSQTGAPPSVTLGCSSEKHEHDCGKGCCCGHKKHLEKCPTCKDGKHGKCPESRKCRKHKHHPSHQHQHHECPGSPYRKVHGHDGKELVEICGRICEVLFDHEGCCCGFVLMAKCCDEELRFEICENCQGKLVFRIKEACERRLTVGVLVEEEGGAIGELGFKAEGS